jgi:hypothetical protein
MGEKIIDRYSLLHFAVGIIMYFLGFSFVSQAVLHSTFEFIENQPFMVNFIDQQLTWWPGGKQKPDAFINSVSDVCWGSLGWLVAYIFSSY